MFSRPNLGRQGVGGGRDLPPWAIQFFSKHCPRGLEIEILRDQTSSGWGPHSGREKKYQISFCAHGEVLTRIWPFCRPVVSTAWILMMMMIYMPTGMWSAWWLPCNGETWSPWHYQVGTIISKLEARQDIRNPNHGIQKIKNPDLLPPKIWVPNEEELDDLAVSDCRAFEGFMQNMQNYSTSFTWFTGIFTSLFEFWSCCWVMLKRQANMHVRPMISRYFTWFHQFQISPWVLQFHHVHKCSRKVGKETTAFEPGKFLEREGELSCLNAYSSCGIKCSKICFNFKQQSLFCWKGTPVVNKRDRILWTLDWSFELANTHAFTHMLWLLWI